MILLCRPRTRYLKVTMPETTPTKATHPTDAQVCGFLTFLTLCGVLVVKLAVAIWGWVSP